MPAPASRSSRWRRCATRSGATDDWHYAYGLAVTQALAGQDPRPAAAQALRLNPLEPYAISLARRLSSDSPARRRTQAARSRIPFG